MSTVVVHQVIHMRCLSICNWKRRSLACVWQWQHLNVMDVLIRKLFTRHHVKRSVYFYFGVIKIKFDFFSHQLIFSKHIIFQYRHRMTSFHNVLSLLLLSCSVSIRDLNIYTSRKVVWSFFVLLFSSSNCSLFVVLHKTLLYVPLECYVYICLSLLFTSMYTY